MKFDKNRAVSWSMIRSFEYDKEEWYRSYVLGQRPLPNKEMIFGKTVADSIENGTCKIPGLLAELQEKKEHGFSVMFGTIKLVGYADAFCDKTFKILDEVKTGKKPWDKARADEHRQIDMYLLMNLITNKIRPEDVSCAIYWIPTEERGDFSIGFVEPVSYKKIPTSRTTADVLRFGAYIQKVHQEMIDYANKISPEVPALSTDALPSQVR